MSCNQNCNQGRACDCGEPFQPTFKDLGALFGLGCFVGFAVTALYWGLV